jgi:hypothetical protein
MLSSAGNCKFNFIPTKFFAFLFRIKIIFVGIFFYVKINKLHMRNSNLFFKIFLSGIFCLCLFIQAGVYSQEQGKANVPGPPTDNATYLSQSIPGMMEPGKSYDVSVSMKNSGSTVWQKGNYKLKLMNQTESIANLWGTNSVDINSTINPGETVTFNFSLKSPETVGDYNMQWQMANGNAFFGEPSATIPIIVTSASKVPEEKTNVNYNAAFKHQNVPNEMTAGGVYDVVIIMKNTGSVDWKPSEDKLKLTTASADDSKNSWGVSTLDLPDPVVAGGEYSFRFNLNAPVESGSYNFQAQMMHNGAPFGEPSPNITVEVK